MARASVTVRTAGPADCDALLAVARRAQSAYGATARVPAGQDAARLQAALSRPEVQVLLAELVDAPAGTTDCPVGVCVLRRGELVPLAGTEAAHVEQLWVHPDHRRRGVAHELLRSATTHAAQAGLSEMTCTVCPADRDSQRFLARLGFTPQVSRRVVSVSALRRRLAGPPVGAGAGPARRQPLEALLARRRQSRVPVGPGTP